MLGGRRGLARVHAAVGDRADRRSGSLAGRRPTCRGAGWVHGLKLAAVAVVAQAVWSMAGSLTPDWPRRVVALAARRRRAGLDDAVLAGRDHRRRCAHRPAAARAAASPPRQRPSRVRSRAGRAWSRSAAVRRAAARPSAPARRSAASRSRCSTRSIRSGALVFGGGHVVLPLLHATVVEPGWVSDGQFLAGYGAAQAVPGPLFTFAAYPRRRRRARRPTASPARPSPRWPSSCRRSC